VVADMDAAHDLLCANPKVDSERIGILGHCWGGRLSWLGPCHNPGFKAAATLYGGRIKATMGPGSVPPISLTANMKCSMLGLFGNDDANPSPEDVNDQEAALKAAGIPYEFHRYDGAGHGFQDFTNAERYREEQSNDAWVKLLDFFDRKLK
jgi:carboxymethylenebutenolidase